MRNITDTFFIVSSNLKKIPTLACLTDLSLEGNAITAVEPNTTFSPCLNWLSLAMNELTQVRAFYFSKLFNLTFLDLRDNKISAVENGSFTDLARLRTLRLSLNNLKTLEPSVLTGLKSCINLSIKDNMIETVDRLLFKQLPSLVLLDMTRNLIKYIEDSKFTFVDSTIEVLSFGAQSIMDISSHTFLNLPSLKTLSLDENFLTEIRSFTFVNLTSLTTLSLQKNQIERIETAAFVNLTSLVLLDLMDNRIEVLNETSSFLKDLKTVRKINFAKNSMHKIGSRCFSKCGGLEELVLYTNMLYQFEAGTFDGLNSTLAILNLNHNRLGLVKFYYFQGLRKLRELLLLGNQISSIDLGSFDDLCSLEKLDLTNNMIFRLDTSVFAKTRNLTDLSLKFNDQLVKFNLNASNFGRGKKFSLFRIPVLTDFFFLNYTVLTHLDLSYCSVEVLQRLSFATLYSLRDLKLNNNKIGTLNNSLIPLGDLESLNLASNSLEFINQSDFSNFSNLIYLTLDSNNIKQFDTIRTQRFFDSLRFLYLSNTSQELVEAIQMDKFVNLEELDVSLNSLTRIVNLTFMKNLTFLNLEGSVGLLRNICPFVELIESLSNLKEVRVSNSDRVSFNKTNLNTKLVFFERLVLVNMSLTAVDNVQIEFADVENIKQEFNLTLLNRKMS
jgi:Leucine-rich repeat (LRR) protein